MSDTVETSRKEGWFWRLLAKRRAKKLEQVKQAIEDGRRYFERQQGLDSEVALFNATPPKELLEAALEAAGLPKDITQVQGRWCVYALPNGGAAKKTCYSARVEGVGLKSGDELVFYLSYAPNERNLEIWFENGKWKIWSGSGEFFAAYPVHDFALL